MGNGMCSRKQKRILQTLLLLTVVFGFIYGAMLYYEVQNQLRKAEAVALKYQQHQESLSAQLQVPPPLLRLPSARCTSGPLQLGGPSGCRSSGGGRCSSFWAATAWAYSSVAGAARRVSLRVGAGRPSTPYVGGRPNSHIGRCVAAGPSACLGTGSGRCCTCSGGRACSSATVSPQASAFLGTSARQPSVPLVGTVAARASISHPQRGQPGQRSRGHGGQHRHPLSGWPHVECLCRRNPPGSICPKDSRDWSGGQEGGT
ncbi:UNVERIFIED_CONTAM: hypothetical protein K2H54_059026 [Gekko kuhli]